MYPEAIPDEPRWWARLRNIGRAVVDHLDVIGRGQMPGHCMPIPQRIEPETFQKDREQAMRDKDYQALTICEREGYSILQSNWRDFTVERFEAYLAKRTHAAPVDIVDRQ